MKRLPLLLAGLSVFVGLASGFGQQAAPSINVQFKDGRTVITPAISRNGNNVMVTVVVGTNSGQVGYPIENIARIDFAEPPQLKTARALFARGQVAEAQNLLAPVLTQFAPFRSVPGSFWDDAATLCVQALQALGRDADADRIVAEMAASPNPDIQRLAKVQQAAALARQGKKDEALALFDEAIAQSSDSETLATAWLHKGRILLTLGQAEQAVQAFLRLPVFYPDRAWLVPQALLGSAQALETLGDLPEAEAHLQTLLRDYPESPSAAMAKTTLEKLKNKQL